MTPPASSNLVKEVSAALDWWRSAGVDCDFDDEAIDWLASNAVESASSSAQSDLPDASPAAGSRPPEPQLPQLGGDAATWPENLAAFRAWWLSDPAIDGGGTYPRIAPEGDEGAALMVLLAEPEEADSDRLLSGPHGALLDGMLSAMGLARSDCYLACALARHTPLPDWGALNAAGLGELVRHHIALARPQRLLAFGSRIPSLSGHGAAQASADSLQFNHGSGRVPVMVAKDLDLLLASWRRRREFWRSWLDWMDETK